MLVEKARSVDSRLRWSFAAIGAGKEFVQHCLKNYDQTLQQLNRTFSIPRKPKEKEADFIKRQNSARVNQFTACHSWSKKEDELAKCIKLDQEGTISKSEFIQAIL